MAVDFYHDEIKPERGRLPFLAHGLLAVPTERRLYLAESLREARLGAQYFGEVHWNAIRGASRQSGGFVVAQKWIETYFGRFVKACPFKAFIIDQDTHRPFPYPGDEGYPEHLERSLQSVLRGTVAWSYNRERQLIVRMVHDDTDSELERSIALQSGRLLQSDWNTRRVKKGRHNPWLRVREPEFSTSTPSTAHTNDPIDVEFIQLCDLLLGASATAVGVPFSIKERNGRRVLAESVMGVLSETLKVPWLQQVPVHRRFSVSIYPDKFNFAYPAALRIAARASDTVNPQLPLCFAS